MITACNKTENDPWQPMAKGVWKYSIGNNDGGIIPMIPPGLHTPKNGEKLSLEVRYYGKSKGEFLLYDDDGETFNYENGDYSWTKLSVEQTADGKYTGTVKRKQGTVFNYKDIAWKFMTK